VAKTVPECASAGLGCGQEYSIPAHNKTATQNGGAKALSVSL
jgi:hypothetical protein